MDILEAKWLPKYGPDVTTKLLETYTPATIKQYSSHWSSFTDWIVRTNQSVSSSALILKYLDYLFSSKDLSVVTLKNHLSAISKPFFMLTGLSIDPFDEKAFMRACFRIRPPPRQLVPQWSLQ